MTLNFKSNLDQIAVSYGLLVGISETIYMYTIGRYSALYLEYHDNEWVAWHETYRSGRKDAYRCRIITRGNTFYYVINQLKRSIDYFEMKRK